jgi:hypothetical protein
VFTTAQFGCGLLGLQLPDLDEKGRTYFEKYVADGHRIGIANLSPEQAVDAIRRGVIEGANEGEPENEPVFFEKLLSDPGGYRYTELLRLVGGSTKRASRPAHTKA